MLKYSYNVCLLDEVCRVSIPRFLTLFKMIIQYFYMYLTPVVNFCFKQIRVLLDRAHAVSKLWDDAPIVLCGDFNCTPKVDPVNYLVSP